MGFSVGLMFWFLWGVGLAVELLDGMAILNFIFGEKCTLFSRVAAQSISHSHRLLRESQLLHVFANTWRSECGGVSLWSDLRFLSGE